MMAGTGRVAAGVAGWPGGPCLPAGVRVFCVVRSPVCGVLLRRASLRSHHRVLPGAAGCAARVPTARNRARCTGRRDCPWFPASCMALCLCGLVPPPGGKLTGSAGCRGRLSHAAAGTAAAPRRGWTCPAAMRASRIVPVVITAHSQRSTVAAHAVRACLSASRFPSRLVRRACLAARTLLCRSAPQTARQAADSCLRADYSSLTCGFVYLRHGERMTRRPRQPRSAVRFIRLVDCFLSFPGRVLTPGRMR
jgi:hypothetical protein